MFAAVFFVQRFFNRNEGYGLQAAAICTLAQAIMRMAVGALNGGSFRGLTVPAFWFSLGLALALLANVYFSAQVFLCANMSVYSVFNMLGGMVLPFFAGILLFRENLTLGKCISFVLIAAAVFCGLEKKEKASGRAPLYYLGVFVTNGMFGIMSKCNQEYGGLTNGSFLLWSAAFAALLCLLYFGILFCRKQLKPLSRPLASIGIAIGGGLMSAFGNYFLLVSLRSLDSSIQYPLVTGGTIVFTVLLSLMAREKPGKKSLISVALSVVASVLIIW